MSVGPYVRGTLCPCISLVIKKLWDLVSYSADLVSGGPYVHETLCPKTVGPCVNLTQCTHPPKYVDLCNYLILSAE